MKQDYTFNVYSQFLETILKVGYKPTTYLDFVENAKGGEREFVLRHDVDRTPENALTMARIQHEKGVRGTYFWRIVDESYDKEIIKEVVSLGHELGFHYEDLTLAKGNKEVAIEEFKKNLDHLRQFYPVKTICMHGSPLTRWDNRAIWDDYDYRDFDIVAEPYFDTNFEEVFYLTDTGRKWNNRTVSIRDRVSSSYNIPISSTYDLMNKLEKGLLPKRLMYNIHPHRWSGNQVSWLKELIGQNMKNVVKAALVQLRKYDT